MKGIRHNILFYSVVFFVSSCGGSGGVDNSTKKAASEIMPPGYTAFDYPRGFDDKPLPGALVAITPNRGFHYLGHLVEDCGLDELELQPLRGVIALPSFTLTEDNSGSIAAGIAQMVKLNLAGKGVSTIKVELGVSHDEAIIPIKAVVNAREREQILRERCGNYLDQDNVYWISSALKADKFILEFKKEDSGSLTVSAENMSEIVSEASVKGQIKATSDGRLEIGTPVYIGFREAVPSGLLTGEMETFSDTGKRWSQTPLGDEVYRQ